MAERAAKRVAFLSFDWDYEIVGEYYRGVEAALEETPGLQVVIFSAFGHYHVRFEPDAGTFKIFSLCDLTKYDGLIVQGNRVWSPAMRQMVVNEAHALGLPVVSINYDLEHAHAIGTNNYEAMFGLVSKVLADREPACPAFVNGLATSLEAQDRAQGYRDACAAAGYENTRFYQAGWQIEDGKALAQQLLESDEDLPDLIFCCNDDLAIGMQDVLTQGGVRVPEDVMITGFDNREISRTVTPRIATVDRDHFGVGKTALATMSQLLRGKTIPKNVYSPVQYLLRESCAYDSSNEEVDNGDLYSLGNSLKRFYEVLNGFQAHINEADSLEDVLHTCESYAHEVRSPRVFLTVSDAYLQSGRGQETRSYGVVSHLMAYTGASALPACDKRHVYASFPSKDVLPSSVMNDTSLCVVYPLHRNETCIGTFVTEGVSPIMGYGFLTFCLTLLAAGIENVRNIELLRDANSHLDNLYVHDELTGLFNRFGFDRFGTIAYEHLLRDFERAFLIFVDVDNMKGVNDRYGHEAGDDALRDTADIIRSAMRSENAFAMRYGGDEFLMICRNDLIPRLEHELELHRQNYERPYELSLSMGAVEIAASDHCVLSEAIRRADKRMYEIKKARRVERG